MKLEDVKDKIDEWFASDECEIYFNKIKLIDEIRAKRFSLFETWLQSNDFDTLLYKIILRHGEDFRNKCYHNGIEPYPQNIMEFIFDYVFKTTNEIIVKELETPFITETHEFKSYYFRIVHGQGCIHSIYNKKDLRMIFKI